ncbi:MAG: T9SS type A sorting domain-containing protein, partial [Bacteroidia bacterium]|nr:T9SS type A sorting domain-containing protein [Bacteroidia bacterium]
TSSKNNVSCNGVNNGTANVSVSGGVAPYAYSWNTNPVKTTAAINNLGGGVYTCTVTDANSCTSTASVNIFDPSVIMAFTIPNNPNPGDVNLLVSGGINPYNYNWSNGVTTEDLFGVSPGVYFCQVSDRNGCAKITSLNMVPPQFPNYNNNWNTRSDHSLNTLKIFPNPGSGIFDVIFRSIEKEISIIRITDLTGRLIFEKRIRAVSSMTNVNFDISSAAEGMYIVSVVSGDQKMIKKVVLSR